MKFTAFIVQSLLWLTIAASPTFLGLIIGGFWADHIRNGIGLSTFLGRLTGVSESRKNNNNS